MEEFYPEPDDNLKKRRFIEYKTTFIDPLFPKDKSIRIADLGCCYGLFLDTCRRLGYLNYEGVELLEKFVNYAYKERKGAVLTRSYKQENEAWRNIHNGSAECRQP